MNTSFRKPPPPPMVGDYIQIYEYMFSDMNMFSTVVELCWSQGYNAHKEKVFVVRDSRDHLIAIVRNPSLDTYMHRGWLSSMNLFDHDKFTEYLNKEKEKQNA